MGNSGYTDAVRIGNMEIIYEDEWLIVVNKPSGLLTMSTGRADDVTAYSLLTDYVRQKSGRRRDVGQERIFIVHRLDRDTSGLLLFAKDQDTKEMLQENWNETVLERKYVAILEGHIDSEEGWIETWLRENPKSMKMQCMAAGKGEDPDRLMNDGWKFASSHCHTLNKGMIDNQAYTMVEFELETGRKNQIRVHAQWIGHPVAGDRKYGAKTNPIGRLALHARTLSFTHPRTGNPLSFTSRLPKGFKLR
ncbi:MAG: RluA family pseudouridine synthase [Candidatus Cryptobacteroides sp.]